MSIFKEIFEFRNYRDYIMDWIDRQPKQGRGQRAALAVKISSPLSHVSQMLGGISNLTLEQAEEANDFFHHDNLESDYFLLLVQLARASTSKLKIRIESQLNKIREKRVNITARLAVKDAISTEQQSKFYSQWYYVAVHVILTIKEYQTKEAIAEYFNLSIQKISEILEFLMQISLVHRDGIHYRVSTSRIHLGSNSPMITKHHTNWRLQAIQSLWPYYTSYGFVPNTRHNFIEIVDFYFISRISRTEGSLRMSRFVN